MFSLFPESHTALGSTEPTWSNVAAGPHNTRGPGRELGLLGPHSGLRCSVGCQSLKNRIILILMLI